MTGVSEAPASFLGDSDSPVRSQNRNLATLRKRAVL